MGTSWKKWEVETKTKSWEHWYAEADALHFEQVGVC